MTAEALPRVATAGPWAPRLVILVRFASLLYVFVVAFLLLAAMVPTLTVGWQPLSVVSGSMQPAVKPGAIVLVEPAAPDRFYSAPSIVAYHDPARPGELVTHRVIGTAADDNGTVSYTTKGDGNRVADSGAVPHDQVVGAVRTVVPYVGLPQMWLHNGDLTRLSALALVSLLAVGALLVRPRR